MILRTLRDNLIDLNLDEVWEGIEEDDDGLTDAQMDQLRQRTLRRFTDLLYRTGSVGNKNKLFVDLHNREKRASTAIGNSIAFPHVRSMQVREFIAAIARSDRGIPFDAPDGSPVRLFFVMAAPPYDDKSYLRAYKTLAGALRFDTVREALLRAQEPHDIILALKRSM